MSTSKLLKRATPFLLTLPSLVSCSGGTDPLTAGATNGGMSHAGSAQANGGTSTATGGTQSLGGALSAGGALGGQTALANGGQLASGGSFSSGGVAAGGTFASGGANGGALGNGGSSNGAGGSEHQGGVASGGATNSGGSFAGGASGMTGLGGSAGTSALGGAGGDLFGGGSKCTSGVTWRGAQGPTMRPGESCPSCHNFLIAGTVFPTGHEPNDCNGVNAGVTVEITDAAGKVLTLEVNSVGNFYTTNSITFPYTAVLRSAKGTRAMSTPQSSPACNGCHTENGTNGAPGRIVAP